MVGLATAWFLQEHDVEVTVLDGEGVAGGASWGNAGWLIPGFATPLPEPAVLRYGVRAVFSPASPVYVPPSLDPVLLRFLAGFTRHSTMRRWKTAMSALIGVNRLALESFDLLGAGGVESRVREARPVLTAFRTARERRGFLTEIEHIEAAGQELAFDVLSGDDAREVEPTLSDVIGAAVRLHGQKYIDPGAYVHALARSVRERGGTVHSGVTVTRVTDTGRAVRMTADGDAHDGDGQDCGGDHDAVVLATGARLGRLARRFGVRSIVQAGRGYSFSIAADHAPAVPLYLPSTRVACTPLADRVRIAGMMEFRPYGAPLDPRRVQAIAAAVRPLLRDADLDDRRDVWVGSRPCTIDGLPLIGATRSPRVFIAGGHGMWGMTLGPVTGRLLAARISTGEQAPELDPFAPLR
jgi:D-amino-acid dehydrogenase